MIAGLVEQFLTKERFTFGELPSGPDFACWEVDIQPLFRRFTNPVRMIELYTSPIAILEGFKEQVRFQLTILFLDAGQLVDEVRQRRPTWAIVTHEDFVKIVNSKRPRGAFANLLRSILPLSRLSPYQTNLVASQGMFFGREEQIQEIMNRATENFAILGPRRIGKSSLAKEIERRLRAAKEAAISLGGDRYAQSVAFVDCNLLPDLTDTDDAFFEVALESMGVEARDTTLNRRLFGRRFRELTPFEFFTKLIRTKYVGITLIIDEIDGLLEKQRAHNWPLLRKIQGLVDQVYSDAKTHSIGRTTIILVGFTTLYKTMYDNSFPFYGRLRQIVLSNLGRDASGRLVSHPMHEIGVKIAAEQDILHRVIHFTGGMPSVIQSLCSEAVKSLEHHGNKELTPDLVEQIIRTQAPLTDYINWFDFSATRDEKIVVYSCAEAGKVGVETLVQELEKKRSFRISRDNLRLCLDRLALANILKEIQRHSAYEFAIEAFRLVMAERLKQHGGRDKLLRNLIEL